jgi:hypothetical protein
MWISNELNELRAQHVAAIDRSQRIGRDLLRAEIKVARGLVSLAEATSCQESGVRHLRNAWRALQSVEDFAEKVNFEGPERNEFRRAHSTLCLRLAKLRTRSERDQQQEACRPSTPSGNSPNHI